MKKYRGPLLIFLLLLITYVLWATSKVNLGRSFRADPLLTISQIFALWGLVLMSLSLLLSTRLHIVENIFGGLDRLYQVHMLIGSLAFTFILSHPILLALDVLPDKALAGIYLLPGQDISYNYGIFALYTMLLAFVFIAFIKLPYQVWRYTHRFLGLAFLLVGLHSMNIASDISSNSLLRGWGMFFILLGLGSFLYTVLLYKYYGPRFLYKVKNIVTNGSFVDLELEKLRKALAFKPGQFAYFSFVNTKVTSEPHPFSFSSGPQENFLRISTRKSGDFTNTLPKVEQNSTVAVYGPYGTFGEFYMSSGFTKLVWLAGGIGITPFLSMLHAEAAKPSGKEIIFYWSVKSKKEAVYDEEIRKLCSKLPHIKYYLWISEENGFLTAKEIMPNLNNISEYGFQICGPLPMMESLSKQLRELGVIPENIRFENFSML